METKIKIAVGVAIAIVCLAAFSFFTVYYVGNDIEGTLYWKGNEAYLFTGESKAGNHFFLQPLLLILFLYISCSGRSGFLSALPLELPGGGIFPGPGSHPLAPATACLDAEYAAV